MRILLGLFLTTLSLSGYNWGFTAHRTINYLACFKLPIEMFGFYKMNILDIEEWAVKADQRRYIIPEEGMGHFIDLDHYESSVPLDTIVKSWTNAIDSLGRDSIEAYGILPWRVLTVFYRLKKAFEEQDVHMIISLSADLGHYVADAHVPLHTTENYNGQLTNQHGIHGLWESRLPELFFSNYDLLEGTAVYYSNPLERIWEIIEESFALKDSVLHIEKAISENFKTNKFSYENRGTSVIKVYSLAFCQAYHHELNSMVERRMRNAISSIASFWYSAWIDAGQPELFIGPLNEKDLPIQADSISNNALIKLLHKRTLIH